MKKYLAVFLVAVAVLSGAYADSDLAVLGLSGGYSTKDDTALLGFNGSYSYYASINESFGVGYGVHGDISFGLNHPDEFLFAMGFLGGLGLEFRLPGNMSLNLTVGPVLVADSGLIEPSIGFGAGVDASFSYFFGDTSCIGIVAGATLYPQFFVLDDSRSTNFSMDVYGYVGMAFRFPASLAALPALMYILD